jgi:hypothetical protein
VRGPSFTDLGKRPVFTPAHQVERPTRIGPCGARIEVSRTKPALGRLSLVCSLSLEFHSNPSFEETAQAADKVEFVAPDSEADGMADPAGESDGPPTDPNFAVRRLASSRSLIRGGLRLSSGRSVPSDRPADPHPADVGPEAAAAPPLPDRGAVHADPDAWRLDA